MNTKFIREKFIQLTGYWTYNKKALPVGADLIVDLKEKIDIDYKTIFDVGANIGQTALEFFKHFPKATIYSFEPVGSTFQKLVCNTKGKANIKCYPIALSDAQEKVQMKVYDGHDSVMNSLKGHLQNGSVDSKVETIETNTLDNFMAEQGINSIDLLKVDTEGYELHVLKGATEALKHNRIKLIYLEVGFSKKNIRNTYFPEVFDHLTNHGFSLFGLYEIHHYDFENENHFGNALFIHNGHLKNNTHY